MTRSTNNTLQDYITCLNQKDVNLTVIDLRNSNIDSHSAVLLFNALKDNVSVTEIYLDYNKIDFEGAGAVATFLRNNTTLIKLSLANCNIKYPGMRAIALATIGNKTLSYLDLSYNSERSTDIAKILNRNMSLTSIYLDENFFAYDNYGMVTICRGVIPQTYSIINRTINRNLTYKEEEAKKEIEKQQSIVKNSFLQTAIAPFLPQPIANIVASYDEDILRHIDENPLLRSELFGLSFVSILSKNIEAAIKANDCELIKNIIANEDTENTLDLTNIKILTKPQITAIQDGLKKNTNFSSINLTKTRIDLGNMGDFIDSLESNPYLTDIKIDNTAFKGLKSFRINNLVERNKKIDEQYISLKKDVMKRLGLEEEPILLKKVLLDIHNESQSVELESVVKKYIQLLDKIVHHEESEKKSQYKTEAEMLKGEMATKKKLFSDNLPTDDFDLLVAKEESLKTLKKEEEKRVEEREDEEKLARNSVKPASSPKCAPNLQRSTMLFESATAKMSVSASQR